MERIGEPRHSPSGVDRKLPSRRPELDRRGRAAPKTFAALYWAYHSYVKHLVRQTGVRDADQADAVQRVFIALAEAIGRGLDVMPSLKPWLKVTTFRIARGYLRLPEQLSADGEIDPIDRTPDPQEAMETLDLRKALDEVLGELAPERRLVLVMSDLDDMTMPEIAATLEIPMDTGYTRLRLARRDFEAAWSRRRAAASRRPFDGALPLVMVDPRVLLDAGRAVPDAPAAFADEVWRGLVEALGPGIVGSAIAGAAGASAGAAVASGKAVSLSFGQIVAAAMLAIGAGAGGYAALEAALAPAPEPIAITGDDARVQAAGPPATGSESVAGVPAGSGSAGASVGASAERDAGAFDGAREERLAILRAAAALEDRAGKPADARAALAILDRHARAHPNSRYGEEREALRRRARELLDGQQKGHDGGTP